MTTLVAAPNPVPTLSMTTVLEVIADCEKDAELLDKKPVSSPSSVDRRTVEAEVSRDLLNLADRLTLAASLVRNEYWTAKGLPSYDL